MQKIMNEESVRYQMTNANKHEGPMQNLIRINIVKVKNAMRKGSWNL